jgi:hypothetical protein
LFIENLRIPVIALLIPGNHPAHEGKDIPVF